MSDEQKFFRCGYCGSPCHESGRPLTVSFAIYDSLIEDNDLPEELLHGECCSDQWNEQEPELVGYVSREMAMDACDMSLEGQPVYR